SREEDPGGGPRCLCERARGSEGTDGDGQRRAVPSRRFGLGMDARQDGSAGGRQSRVLGRRKGAAHAGGRDAVAAAQARLSAMSPRRRLRAIMRGILGSLIIVGGATSAHAQAPLTEAAKAMAGINWEFSNADRDKRCTVTFRTDTAAVGMRLEFDSGCAALFPFTTEIVGWTLAENDFLRMLDA